MGLVATGGIELPKGRSYGAIKNYCKFKFKFNKSVFLHRSPSKAFVDIHN